MKEFKLHKEPDTISWKVGRQGGAYAHLRLTHNPDHVHDALLELEEGYISSDTQRAVAKEAWMYLTPEDLDALANAALVMAEDIRLAQARRERAEGPQPQHDSEYPHGISCPGCRALQVCNECGRARGAAGRHEVRKGVRCTTPIGCTNGRCDVCCKTVCEHAKEAGVSHG